MTIEWIDVKTRVPNNRRRVLVCGAAGMLCVTVKYDYITISKYNPGGKFDSEQSRGFFGYMAVTHWAEITLPIRQIAPPPKQP